MSTVDKFKNWFSANAASLFGPSWRSTLGGYAQLFLVSAYHAYLLVEGKPLTLSDVIQILVSAIFAVVLKEVKDSKHIDVPQDVADAAQAKVISTLDGLLVKPVVVVPPPVVVAAPAPPAPPAPPAAPAPPAPPAVTDPGSPYSIKCLATCFGYEDPGDNGIGAYVDPSTGKSYATNNKTLVGVSVPIPIVTATCPDGAAKYKVSVIAGGRTAHGIAIVDKGPGETVNGQHGLVEGSDGVLHAIDFTYGMCEVLGLKYDANDGSFDVTYWITDESGSPVVMKGLDAPKKIV